MTWAKEDVAEVASIPTTMVMTVGTKEITDHREAGIEDRAMAIRPRLTWFVTTVGKRAISRNSAQVSDAKTVEMVEAIVAPSISREEMIEEAIVAPSINKEEMIEETHIGVAKTMEKEPAIGVVNLVISQETVNYPTLKDDHHTASFVANKVISRKSARKRILIKTDNSSVTNVANLVTSHVTVLTPLPKISKIATIALLVVTVVIEIISKCRTEMTVMIAMIVVVMRVIREHVTSAESLVILPEIVQMAIQQIARIVAIEVIT